MRESAKEECQKAIDNIGFELTEAQKQTFEKGFMKAWDLFQPIIQTYEVCDSCKSLEIVDINCVCVEGKYKTVAMEFEVCGGCGSVSQFPADTENNDKIYEQDDK